MKRFLQVVVALATVAFAVNADAPAGYYNSISGLKDKALKDQLQVRIHDGKAKLGYDALWTMFYYVDCYPVGTAGSTDSHRLMWDMYSDNLSKLEYYFNLDAETGKVTYEPAGEIDREHCVPKSWWGSGSTKKEIEKYECGTDLLQLYPADGSANSSKGNYPLGYVAEGGATLDNGVSKTGKPKDGYGGGAIRVFEPGDEYKGDFARTYFYVATAYQDYNWEVNYMFNNVTGDSDYLSLSPWAYEMLLDWCRRDPVSEKELKRNDAVFELQGNRNPFIDNPDLVEYIWGNKRGEGYVLSEKPSLITPTNGAQLAFGEVVISTGADQQIYIKGGNILSDLTLALTDENGVFSLASTIVSAVDANKGVAVNINCQPTAEQDYSAILTITGGGLEEAVSMNITATGVIQLTPIVDVGSVFNVLGIDYTVTSLSPATLSITGADITTGTVINVPETLHYGYYDFVVNRIAANAFKDRTDITALRIPATVTNIATTSFTGCSNITRLTFGAMTTYINAAMNNANPNMVKIYNGVNPESTNFGSLTNVVTESEGVYTARTPLVIDAAYPYRNEADIKVNGFAMDFTTATPNPAWNAVVLPYRPSSVKIAGTGGATLAFVKGEALTTNQYTVARYIRTTSNEKATIAFEYLTSLDDIESAMPYLVRFSGDVNKPVRFHLNANTALSKSLVIPSSSKFCGIEIEEYTFGGYIGNGDIDAGNARMASNGNEFYKVIDATMSNTSEAFLSAVPEDVNEIYFSTSGVEGVVADHPNQSVVAGKGVININCEDFAAAKVYNVNGMLVATGKREVTCGAGVYVVTINGVATKVVVR